MITIYGASDDLVEVSGCEGADEFNTDNWSAHLIGPGAEHQMLVHCWYSIDGCWQVGIGQALEDAKLPPWPVTIRQGIKGTESAYSVVLCIDAPEGTRLDVVPPGGLT